MSDVITKYQRYQKYLNFINEYKKAINASSGSEVDSNANVESKNIADSYVANLKKLDKDAFKDQIKASKEIAKKIDTIINLYFGKPDNRQGITSSDDIPVRSRIGTASWYVQSRKNGITTTEKTLITHAEEAVSDLVTQTNTFFAEDWKNYQVDMEKLKLNPFKPVQIFLLDTDLE